MYAARKGWPLERVSIGLTLVPAPKGGDEPAQIAVQLDLRGQLDGAQRERLLQVANACPTHRILTRATQIATSLTPESAERQ
jgi:putative redox protein